jgi:hypothetical protein
MHLQLSQLVLPFRGVRFVAQKVEFAGGRIALNLPIPILPIPFRDPFPQSCEILTREGFNFGLNRFDLSHGSIQQIVSHRRLHSSRLRR